MPPHPLPSTIQYYSVFDPFTSLTSMPDPFSILPSFGAEPRGRSRALVTDYPMVGHTIKPDADVPSSTAGRFLFKSR